MVTKNPGLATGVSNGGGGRIRTFEDRSRQIYSLMRLTASLPHRGIFWSRAYKRQPIRLSTANPEKISGTGGGGRTHTPLREPDFESGASANSATPA